MKTPIAFLALYNVILLFCIPAVLSGATLVFDDAFENGHLNSVVQDNNLYTLDPPFWIHFRIRGALGATPEFRIFQGSNYIYRNDHRMVYRYEGQEQWNLFDAGFVLGDYYYFHNNSAFNADSVYVAYWYPWTFSQMQAFMQEISGQPFVQNQGPRGYSLQGREIYGYEITDPAVPDALKTHIVLIARQHAAECLGSHIVKGLSEYLIYSLEEKAREIRQSTVFHIYPMANPDGVFLGLGSSNAAGQDLNRSWLTGTQPSGCIENDLI